MIYFWLGFLVGSIFATLLMGVLQVNADNCEQDRAEYAINIAYFYKAKCKELQVDVESKQAEINRWEHLCKAKNMLIAELDMSCKADKTEAYKEFADRLKEEIKQALESNYRAVQGLIAYYENQGDMFVGDEFVDYCNGKIDCLQGLDDFCDNLLKELTERKED